MAYRFFLNAALNWILWRLQFFRRVMMTMLIRSFDVILRLRV